MKQMFIKMKKFFKKSIEIREKIFSSFLDRADKEGNHNMYQNSKFCKILLVGCIYAFSSTLQMMTLLTLFGVPGCLPLFCVKPVQLTVFVSLIHYDGCVVNVDSTQ